MVYETILVVEDDIVQRTLLLRLLLKQGYSVLEACDGCEALEVCERHQGPIDLLITDVVMPRMISGPELAERLILLRPNVKVLYTSAYADHQMIHSFPACSTSFLPKPFMPPILHEKVRQLLDADPKGPPAREVA